MAATSMRIPGKHQAPLKTLNRGNTFLRSHRAANTAKRKSAVELLQESKAFYVKSETVLDRQQQLKHAGHLQVTSSAVDTVFLRGPRPRSDPAPDHKYIHTHVLLLSPSVAPLAAGAPPPVGVRPPPALPAAPPSAPQPPQPPAAPAAPAPPPPLPPKSPRLVSAAQRRAGSHPSGGSDQLQTKLRRLLNADSKENLFVGGGGSAWPDEDCKTVACDERPFTRNVCPRSPAGCSIHKSLPDLHAGAVTSPTASTDASEIRSVSRFGRRSCGSAMSTHSSGFAQKALKESAHRNIPNSTTMVNSHHRVHSIVKTDVIHTSRSGAQSLDTYKNEISPESVPSAPISIKKSSRLKEASDVCDGPASNSSFSDSGAEDISSPKPLRTTPSNCGIDRHRPILRSKSDISHRYSRGNISMPRQQPQEPYSDEKLEQFFEQLGLEAGDYKTLATPVSGSSSPVFFDSVSSVDSAVVWGPESGGTSGNHQRPSEQLSIVERNARIIKWLCNCRKAQLATHSPS